MKRKTVLAVASLLTLAVHGAAFSANTDSPYPADAEASFSLPALDSYAEQQARQANAQPPEQWGVGKRQQPTPHDPFPFGGGYHDD
jgi:hypothetical protein